MVRKQAVMGVVVLGLLMASPAMATIDVYLAPANQVVDIANGTTTVDLVADIPLADAIIGWGLDLSLGGDLNVSNINVAIAPAFDAVAALDGDGLAGLVNFMNVPVSGSGVVLATVTFSLDALGTTSLTLSDNSPGDVTEGFARDDSPPDFAIVSYTGGSIEVVPEPASLALLLLGGVAVLRRR